MLNNEFRGLPNGEHIITDDGNLTILEFYGMRGPVMGNVAGTLGVLGAISLMFMCAGIYGLKHLRFEKRQPRRQNYYEYYESLYILN